MRFGHKDVGMDYDPIQLLDSCRVQKFERDVELNYFVEQILALIVIEKDPDNLVSQLKQILLKAGSVSIGKSLDYLASVASIGNEFQGGLDGVDALSHHLGGHQCEKAIEALTKVLDLFKIEKEYKKAT